MSKRYLRLHESHIYPFVSLFTLEAIIVFVHGEPLGLTTLVADPFVRLFDFDVLEKASA